MSVPVNSHSKLTSFPDGPIGVGNSAFNGCPTRAIPASKLMSRSYRFPASCLDITPFGMFRLGWFFVVCGEQDSKFPSDGYRMTNEFTEFNGFLGELGSSRELECFLEIADLFR